MTKEELDEKNLERDKEKNAEMMTRKKKPEVVMMTKKKKSKLSSSLLRVPSISLTCRPKPRNEESEQMLDASDNSDGSMAPVVLATQRGRQ